MLPPQLGVAIAENVSSLLSEWGIERKVFSITLDCHSSNDVFIQVMKNQLILRNALLSDESYFMCVVVVMPLGSGELKIRSQLKIF